MNPRNRASFSYNCYAIAVSSRSLSEYFLECRLHVVVAYNCLDHCYDPVKAIGGMYVAAKRGGILLLEHYKNVAERELYSGLHQWNFSEKDGRLMLWNRNSTVFVEEHLPPDARISVSRLREQNWISAEIRKPT